MWKNKLYRKYFKRFFDIIISIIALPFFFLLLLIIAPVIYLSDKGSIFYIASRLGKDGKVFKMYKFRSMKMNAPDIRNSDGSTYNSNNDLRLTKIGKLLRKTSIDELPQIINVLKGDMSFIGPRPDLPEHFELYTKNEVKKLTVLPGITGLNQAYYRNSIAWKERNKNDIEYVERVSLKLDLMILFRTIKVILSRSNVYIESKGDDDENN